MIYTAEQFLTDVREVVAYNWADEAADCERAEREGDECESHIFGVLQRIDAFVGGTKE